MARALQLLEKRQSYRRQQEEIASAEAEMNEDLHPEVFERNTALSEPSPRSGSFRADPQTPPRRPAEAPENLALRL